HDPLEAGLSVDVQGHSIQLAPLKAGYVERGLPQRLGWKRARVHACAPHDRRAFHQRHLLAEIRSLRRTLLAGRAGPDDDEIEPLWRGHEVSRSRRRDAACCLRSRRTYVETPLPRRLLERVPWELQEGQPCAVQDDLIRPDRDRRRESRRAACGDEIILV